MAEFVGSAWDLGPVAAPPAPSPHTGGKVAVVGARRVSGWPAFESGDVAGAAFDAAGGVTPPSPSPVELAASVQEATAGATWFGRIHLLPREPIDFGNVITTATAKFELFNAFTTSATLSSITNNVGVGVSVPNAPATPYVAGAFTSVLDPSSTRLSPVRLDVQVDTEGPATFDGTIDFLWAPGGLLMLRILGSRITFVAPEWEFPFTETLEHETAVLARMDGTEQRIQTRKQPRQVLDVTYRLDDLDRRLMQVLLFDWQGRQFAVPLWQERMPITQAITGGATATANVLDTTDVDLRDGGLAVVFKDNRTFDVLEVLSQTATSVTFASTIQNSYAVGDVVMPARTAHVVGAVRGNRFPVNLEDFRVRWRVVDNDTGALTASTAAFSSFGGKVLLDDCNIVSAEGVGESYDVRVTVIDGVSGLFSQNPVWAHNRRSHRKTFYCETRSALRNVRRLLQAFRGRQVAFWLPTFIEDLLVTQTISTGTDTMVVENVGYTRFVASREHKASFRITFTDGAVRERTILSSVETSATEETLTIDTNWDLTRTAAQVSRVEFLELARLAEDDVQITHEAIGRAKVAMPVETVFDQ